MLFIFPLIPGSTPHPSKARHFPLLFFFHHILVSFFFLLGIFELANTVPVWRSTYIMASTVGQVNYYSLSFFIN